MQDEHLPELWEWAEYFGNLASGIAGARGSL